MLYLKLAWRNIWRNKRRTLITVASILFAVFFAVFLRSMQEGAYGRMIENIAGFYTGYAQIQKKDFWKEKSLNDSFEYDQNIEDKLKDTPHLETLVPRLESFALAYKENVSKGALVVGIDPQRENKLTHLEDKLVTGDYIELSEKSVLVAQGLAEYLKLNIGDTITLISAGFRGANAAGKYPIKGIVRFGMPELNNTTVFLPLGEAQWFFAAENRVTALAMVVDKAKNVDKMVDNARTKMDLAKYDVMSWKDMLPELVQQIELDRVGGLIMLSILYLIIGFGIFGTILMMTAERRREFGVLMAIGMKRLRLILVTWLEIILLGLVGALAGILVSLPVIFYFSKNPIRFTGDWGEAYEKFGIEPVIPAAVEPNILLIQACFVVLMTSLIAIYPLWSINRLRPVDAMRG